MSNGLPEGKRIRIRSFYGFSPEEDGYVGWSQEQARDAYTHLRTKALRGLV